MQIERGKLGFIIVDHFGRARVRWRIRSARADSALVWGNKPRGAATAQILHVRIRSRLEGSRRENVPYPYHSEDSTINTNYGEAPAVVEECCMYARPAATATAPTHNAAYTALPPPPEAPGFGGGGAISGKRLASQLPTSSVL